MIARELFWTLARYFSVSVGVYVFILLGMYLLVDCLQINKTVSYILIYLCAYLAEYAMTLTLVFRSDHSWLKVLKFVTHIVCFLTLGTTLFASLLHFNVNYLCATLGVAFILLPFRFLSNKYFVYK